MIENTGERDPLLNAIGLMDPRGGYIEDMEKYNELALAGYYLLRFTPEQEGDGRAIHTIKRWFHGRGII